MANSEAEDFCLYNKPVEKSKRLRYFVLGVIGFVWSSVREFFWNSCFLFFNIRRRGKK